MKQKLNKCIHCGGWAFLVRRGKMVNYRCANKFCLERMITDDYPNTKQGMINARNEWNLLNPAPSGEISMDMLRALLGQHVHVVASSHFFSFSLAGMLDECEDGQFQLSTDGCGCALSFRLAMVQEIQGHVIRLGFQKIYKK